MKPLEDLHDAAARVRSLRMAILTAPGFDEDLIGFMGVQHEFHALGLLEAAAAQLSLAAYHQAQALAAAPR